MEVRVTRSPINDELYHYGIPGMKWGRRKHYMTDNIPNRSSRSTAQNTHRESTSVHKPNNITRRNNSSNVYSNDARAMYKQDSRRALAQRYVGIGLTAAGGALQTIGKHQIKQLKGGGTTGQIAVATALNYGGKALMGAGSLTAATGVANERSARKEYERNTRLIDGR